MHRQQDQAKQQNEYRAFTNKQHVQTACTNKNKKAVKQTKTCSLQSSCVVAYFFIIIKW